MPQPTHTRRSLTVFTALAPTIGAGMALVIALPALAQETVTRNQRLLLSPASVAASQRFGAGSAVESGVAVFGAPGVGAGSASIFERGSSNSWSLAATVSASDGAANDGFGTATAIDGSIAVVGAPAGPGSALDAGAVYIFRKVGASWSHVAKVTASDGANGDAFGASVSIKGDTLVVGAPTADAGAIDAGAAYVFRNTTGNTWSEQTKLVAASAAANARFGTSVATRSSRALIGAPGTSGGAGRAHLFRNSGGTWTLATELASAEAGALAFGTSVALAGTLAGDWAFVGAPNALAGAVSAGAAFIFTRSSDTNWPQTARVTQEDAAAGDQFGASIAAYDDRVIVGAPSDTVRGVSGAGSATTFRRSTDQVWRTNFKLASTSGYANGHFGQSVAIAGERVMVGAPDAANTAAQRGGGFHYKLEYVRSSIDDNASGDVVWFSPTAGKVSSWSMNGLARDAAYSPATSNGGGFQFDGCGDFYGDGRTAVVMRRKSDGALRLWRLSTGGVTADAMLSNALSYDWRVLAVADFSGDGRADILFRRTSTSQIALWQMSGSTKLAGITLGTATALEFLAVADIDADGRTDILWRDSGGVLRAWIMGAGSVTSIVAVAGAPAMPVAWALVGTGDLDADGDDDFVWRNKTTGAVQGWMMNGASVGTAGSIAAAVGLQWRVESMNDLDGDGDDDLVWRNKATGAVHAWLMSGFTKSSTGFVRNAASTWSILSDDDDNDDRGHDGNGDDDNNDDDNGDDWNDDHGGSDDDDDDDNGGSSGGGGGDDTVSGATFVNALNAAMSSSALPVLEAEVEREGSTDYLEVLQWNGITGQFTRVLVHASTLAITSTFTWTPSSAQLEDYEDAIAMLNSVNVSPSVAITQVLASRPGWSAHAVELESEDSGPEWKVEIISSTGQVQEIAVSAD